MIEKMHTDKKATRESWKVEPCPPEREALDLQLVFTDAEGERLILGHIPTDMDDKWFIFCEAGWLYFHRSWTGHCIYGMKLDASPVGVRVAQCWASRDRNQYSSPGVEAEKKLIAQVISAKLLY